MGDGIWIRDNWNATEGRNGLCNKMEEVEDERKEKQLSVAQQCGNQNGTVAQQLVLSSNR
jgi:hypothetical protein